MLPWRNAFFTSISMILSCGRSPLLQLHARPAKRRRVAANGGVAANKSSRRSMDANSCATRRLRTSGRKEVPFVVIHPSNSNNCSCGITESFFATHVLIDFHVSKAVHFLLPRLLDELWIDVVSGDVVKTLQADLLGRTCRDAVQTGTTHLRSATRLHILPASHRSWHRTMVAAAHLIGTY